MTPDRIAELIGDFDLDSLPETASKSKNLEWVHTNLGRQRPDMATCPSLGGWGEYIQAIDRPKDFYDRFHKVVQEAVSEDQKRIDDHAGDTTEIINRIFDFCLREDAEVAPGELEVSREHPEDGGDEPVDS